MRVFVTGATGFIGAAVVQELAGAGHEVTGLARSDASARALAAAGVAVHRGELADLDGLRRGAAASDGVVHLGFIHDFSDYASNCATDLRAVEAMCAALAGSDRPFILTSGLMGLTPGAVTTEAATGDAAAPGALRVRSELAALAMAAQGVRSMVIRLPPSVHGAGDHGFVPALIAVARETGVAGHVDAGDNRWPAVHRLDAARLYRLALERGAAGSRFHAVGDEGVPTRDIAAVIGRRLGVPVASRPPEHFGWLGRFFGLDAVATATQTRERLGWAPTGPGLLADLDQAHYFDAR